MPSSRFGKPSSHSVSESAVLITALPPFSTLMTQIAFRRKQVRQGLELVQISDQLSPILLIGLGIAFRILRRGIVSGHTMYMSILTGREGQQRGTTKGRRDITASEDDAFRGQLIQVRRFYLRMPHETIIRPRLIVRDDVNNIGRGFGGECPKQDKQQT